MDARKASSLSATSDGSDSSLHSVMNLVLEQIGLISLLPESEQTEKTNRSVKISSSGNFISALLGEGLIYLAELKLRSDSTDCQPSRSATLELPGIEEKKKYLDCSILQFQSSPNVRLVLLGERKNKERFVSVVEVVTSGRSLSLSREMAVYDKASMLGKNLTHITGAGDSDVFTCGNLIRKLKMEDGGNLLKPTTGRVQVPPECVDGTLCLCIVSASHKNSFTVICSFRTKSAGKNKYQINWYQGRNDEISAPTGKSSLKLSEDQEPAVIMSDPRDARSVYVICNNASEGSSSLYKLARGRKLEEPITTFTFPVTEASMMLGTDKNLFLLILDPNSNGLKVFHVMKTQGYRGSQATWSKCPDLQSLSPNYHAVSCSQNKWQLSPSITDSFTSQRCPYQLGLATLVNGNNDIVNEPESGSQYRIRAVGGDAINDVILIILDDIERCFESEEELLSSMTLKICMNTQPKKEGIMQLVEWLNNEKIISAEISAIYIDKDSCGGLSEKLQINSIGQELFRSYVVDQDWTQNFKRNGTFVLEDSEMSTSLTNPAHIRAVTPLKSGIKPVSSRSKIPSATSSHRKSTTMENSFTNGSMMSTSMSMSMMTNSDEVLQAVRQVEDSISPLARANNQIRDSLAQLEKSLIMLKSVTVVETPNSD